MFALCSCAILIPGAGLGAGDGKKVPALPIFATPSCISMEGVAHVASSEELTGKAGAPVIIGRNLRVSLDGYQINILQVEYFPIFVHSRRAEKGISKAQVKDVLEGKIRDWRDLDQKEGRIQLYLHGGELQKRAFQGLYTLLNADPRKLATVEPRYEADYDKLRQAAGRDENGMAFGLNTWTAENLKLLSVDGISLLNPLNRFKYPLQVPVYLYERKGSAEAASIRAEYLQRLKQNIDKIGSPP